MIKENKSINSNINNHPSYQSKFVPTKPTIKVNYQVKYNRKDLECQIKKNQGKKKFVVNNNTETLNNKQNYQNGCASSSRMNSRVKSIQSRIKQYASGKFIGSQYYPNEQKQQVQKIKTYRKGQVTNSKQKYQYSKSLQNLIKSQNVQKKDVSCYVSQSRANKLKTQNSINEIKSCKNYQNNSFKLSISKYSSINSKYSSINNNCSYDSRVTQRNRLPSYQKQGIKDIIEYEHAGMYKQEKVANKVNNQKAIKDKFRAFNQIHDFDFRKRVNTLSNQVRLTKGLR